MGEIWNRQGLCYCLYSCQTKYLGEKGLGKRTDQVTNDNFGRPEEILG